MSKAIIWNAASDAAIIRLRADGFSWDYIAGQLSISRQTVIEHGRFIGAKAPEKEVIITLDDDRRPLAAGSLETWGAIVAGTCLEGVKYPAYSHAEVARAYAQKAIQAHSLDIAA